MIHDEHDVWMEKVQRDTEGLREAAGAEIQAGDTVIGPVFSLLMLS